MEPTTKKTWQQRKQKLTERAKKGFAFAKTKATVGLFKGAMFFGETKYAAEKLLTKVSPKRIIDKKLYKITKSVLEKLLVVGVIGACVYLILMPADGEGNKLMLFVGGMSGSIIFDRHKCRKL
jgi:hypothetical protein